MTDELFTALAKYEDTFDRVKRRVYTPSPGLQALQTMLTAIREHRPNYHTNLGCSSCVRSLVLEASGLYYTEKDRREKEAAELGKAVAEEITKQVAVAVEKSKKTTRKKKTAE